ncbi:MAG TPA: hypothetical protein PKV33_10720 [Methanothrix sp.]|nr:hypothetical protein [Methanothrix sp.]
MKSALQEYLENYSDCLNAPERLNDKNDKVISREEMMALIGIPN